MAAQPLNERQLEQAKVQLLGQMAMTEENNGIQMQHQARTLLDYGQVYTFKEFMHEIQAVTSEQLIEVAREMFHPDGLSVLSYVPEEEK